MTQITCGPKKFKTILWAKFDVFVCKISCNTQLNIWYSISTRVGGPNVRSRRATFCPRAVCCACLIQANRSKILSQTCSIWRYCLFDYTWTVPAVDVWKVWKLCHIWSTLFFFQVSPLTLSIYVRFPILLNQLYL